MDEGKKIYIKLVCSFLVGFMVCYTLLCSRESAEMEHIRKQYQDSAEQCRILSEQLDQSRKRVEAIEASISASTAGIQEAERGIGNVKSGLGTDVDRLKECQRIISELRKEYESKN